jgi:hypothetical protein
MQVLYKMATALQGSSAGEGLLGLSDAERVLVADHGNVIPIHRKIAVTTSIGPLTITRRWGIPGSERQRTVGRRNVYSSAALGARHALTVKQGGLDADSGHWNP